MTENNNPNKKYDLEERTLVFAKYTIRLCQKLARTPINLPLISQIVRSSASVGANYREANDALGKKDFIHRLKIARKEAKETIYWLELLIEANTNLSEELGSLKSECIELRNILSAIIKKSSL
ncbi:MAG: four helix bundle protein [Candidatus Blackburnbacteria bacterium]|nr:four helix bundle protein [Candidatus Blackburnbacteria bacterium]